MIPELRTCSVAVKRVLVGCDELRTFCALLYACRELVGEYGASETWRRFIEPIWRFHNRALASPLPLTRRALLNPEEVATIEREAVAVKRRRPDLADTVTALTEALATCRQLATSPLGDAVTELIAEHRPDAILIGADDDTFVSSVRDELGSSCPTATFYSRSEQRKARDRLRGCCNGLVTGKLEHVERSLMRAPHGDVHLIVVQYDWARDIAALDATGPWLVSLGGNEGCAHVTVSEETIRRTRFASATNPSSQLPERPPFIRVDPWEAFATVVAPEEGSGASVHAHLLIVAGPNRELLATLLNEDGSADVLRSDGDQIVSLEARVADIRPGDLYLRHGDPTDQDAIAQLADELLRHQGNADYAKDRQREWKDHLRAKIELHGLTFVTREIATRCPGWKPDEHNVQRWASFESLGPQQKQAFWALCQYLQISDDDAAGYWKALKAIHQARITAGKTFNARMVQHVLARVRNEGLPGASAETTRLGGRQTTLYPVELLSSTTREVPRSWLQRDPLPVNSLDLEEALRDPWRG